MSNKYSTLLRVHRTPVATGDQDGMTVPPPHGWERTAGTTGSRLTAHNEWLPGIITERAIFNTYKVRFGTGSGLTNAGQLKKRDPLGARAIGACGADKEYLAYKRVWPR